mgnify:CR=1 FL=1
MGIHDRTTYSGRDICTCQVPKLSSQKVVAIRLAQTILDLIIKGLLRKYLEF